MSGFLRQGTSATIRFGAMQSTTDGSAATGATLTVKLSKAGGAIAARNDATSITHDSDGYYLVTLNATDTGTVGRLRVLATASGCLPAWEHYTVLAAAVYDWLFGSVAPSTLAAADVLATALTESYAADGAAPTLTQAILAIQQRLLDFSISGVNISVKKLDGTTQAMVLTLNDATSPTSSSRTG